MTNMPLLNSYTVADQRSGEVRRVTQASEDNPSPVTEVNDAGEQIQVGNHVHISEEAFDRYRDYTDSLKAAGATSNTREIPAGVAIHDPHALSEEESKALRDSLMQDPLTRAFREIGERFQVIDKATTALHTTSDKLEQTYDDLMQRISQHRPDLANEPFGFSVNAEGKIVLLNTGTLNDEQIDYLDQVLNASSTLVEQAIDVANAHIALTEAEWWNKGITLNRENYARTIDLGADLLYRRESKALPRGTDYIPTAPIDTRNYWRNQLTSNGESVA